MSKHVRVQAHTRYPVIISENDYLRIKRLIGENVQGNEMSLAHEVSRAIVVNNQAFPAHAIGVHSQVLIRDLDTDLEKSFTLVWPSNADIRKGHVSITSPMGVALLGFRQGESIRWKMPGGLKRFQIVQVDNSRRSEVH